MGNEAQSVFLDGEVSTQILGILTNAKEYAFCVTPYVRLWGHAQKAVSDAVRRRVKVYFVVRKNTEESLDQEVGWLIENGAIVYALEDLHAKVYFNEKTTLLSSMNLTASSSTNSFEVATLVNDLASARQVREYVLRRLVPSSMLVKDNFDLLPRSRGPRLEDASGYCIRCGDDIDLDPSHPLCDACYAIWAQYQNPDYEEEHCHLCGRPADVTYMRPLCGICYGQSRRSW